MPNQCRGCGVNIQPDPVDGGLAPTMCGDCCTRYAESLVAKGERLSRPKVNERGDNSTTGPLGDEVRELSQADLQMMRDIAGDPAPTPGIFPSGTNSLRAELFMREFQAGVPRATGSLSALALPEYIPGRHLSKEACQFIYQRRNENPALSIYSDDQLALMYEAQVVLHANGIDNEVEDYLMCLSTHDLDTGRQHPILGVLANLAYDLKELRDVANGDAPRNMELDLEEEVQGFATENGLMAYTVQREPLVHPPAGYSYEGLMGAARVEFPEIVERMREIDNAGWLRCFRRWHTKHPGGWFTVFENEDGSITLHPPVTAAEVNANQDAIIASIDGLSLDSIEPRG